MPRLAWSLRKTSHNSRRRGIIAKLAHSGIPPKAIMELAGHRHLGTTQRIIESDDEMIAAMSAA
jgi:integrase/recombinase XerD